MSISGVNGGNKSHTSKKSQDTGIKYTKCAAYGVAAIAGLGLVVAAAAAALAIPGLNPWQIGGLSVAGFAGAGLSGGSVTLMIRGVEKDQKEHRLKEKREQAHERVVKGEATKADWLLATSGMDDKAFYTFVVQLGQDNIHAKASNKECFNKSQKEAVMVATGGRIICLLKEGREDSAEFQKLSKLYANWLGGDVGVLKSFVASEKIDREERAAAAQAARDEESNQASYR